MSFSSASFFLLLFVTLAAYRYAPLYAKKVFLASPAVARNIVILAASAVFYAFAGVRYLPLLGAAAFASFSSGLALARMEQPHLRKALLAAALCLLFGSLCFFKYGGLFGTARAMPLGISFYTFALAGYLIDQYRRKYAPEPDFLRFAGFACFFPLIASGPIERGDGLLSQMAEPPQPRYGMFCEGASRMLWGFFKKFVVADTIGVTVGRVFADIPAFSGPYLLLAALLYSYELYCDFSGYSDIAIGAARLFGFSVRENFMRPFAARSFGELWRRWHISLTSWLREYIYFPLGGSRKGTARTVCNILMIFFISGIWHGAGAFEWYPDDFWPFHCAPEKTLGGQTSAGTLPESARRVADCVRLSSIFRLRGIFPGCLPAGRLRALRAPVHRLGRALAPIGRGGYSARHQHWARLRAADFGRCGAD